MPGDLFREYRTEGFFDEVFSEDGKVRGHYEALVDRLSQFDADDLARRERRRDAAFRSQGITFTVYGEGEGIERTFPMDLLPRVVPADEWDHIEAGLVQRVTALNRFLDDLYVGERAAVHDGIVPWWLVSSSDGFAREAFGVPMPLGARCLVAGSDLVRDAEGTYRVLEDNLRNPSGISYVVENRVAMTRLLPHVFADTPVRPVDHYGRSFLGALSRVAPPAAGENPTIVVLTPGVYNSAYFEHVFLAAHMGVELVEGRDLVVDDHVVYMRTTRGLKRVDVIYRRIDDDFLDPVVFRPDSTLGVPGLLAAVRAGNVTVTNAIGNGVADDKAVYAYVPEMVRYYLGEEPLLPNVETYLLWDEDQRHAVLDRLDELVVKPVAEAGGYGITIGPAASDEELAICRRKILADPRNWIAQEVVSLSRHPTLDGDHLEGRHVDLRPFVLTSDAVEVIPGGLTRVAMRKGSLVVNSSQGGGSKDTWVLARTAADLEDEEAALRAKKADDLVATGRHRAVSVDEGATV
ncbi:MAG: circularly permuted type 2 ATP-grasp protein [Acidimicrobiales bacterium]|nr:circularly permuted type 2 ATP-grasp protein [Acidimicrobiales bacterium]